MTRTGLQTLEGEGTMAPIQGYRQCLQTLEGEGKQWHQYRGIDSVYKH
jgi:hypothetical protein